MGICAPPLKVDTQWKNHGSTMKSLSQLSSSICALCSANWTLTDDAADVAEEAGNMFWNMVICLGVLLFHVFVTIVISKIKSISFRE
eukprot:gene723-12024_t